MACVQGQKIPPVRKPFGTALDVMLDRASALQPTTSTRSTF